MYGKMKEHLSKTLAEIKEAGLYKEERLIESAQQAAITCLLYTSPSPRDRG